MVLLAGAVCISFAAIFVKLLSIRGMGPTAIAFWRMILGAGILFLWATVTCQKIILPRSILRWTVVAGLLFFLDLFFWHRSIIYSGAGMATILANTQVFVTAMLGYLIFKERLSLRFFIAALSAIGGVILLAGVGSEIEFSRLYINGVLFGLLTGLVYAHYIVVLKLAGHEQHRFSFISLMAWTSLFGALFLGVATLSTERGALFPPDWLSFFIVFALALVAQAVGWWAISQSLPKIPASRSGLILLLQPVLATVWGVIFFEEYLTIIQILGATITLTAIYIGTVSSRKIVTGKS